MITFATNVLIERDTEAVFAVVADPTTYPSWNSAVERVLPLPGEDRRFAMQRMLPSGRARNLLEIDAKPPDEVVVRASQGPTPFTYRYRLRPADGATELSLEAEVTVERLPHVLEDAAARVIRRGVDANLQVLRQILERRGAGGVVYDGSSL